MGSQNITKNDGNWTELRRLVLRLLEEHEEELEKLVSCLQGDEKNKGMLTRIALVERSVKEMKDTIEAFPESGKKSVKDHAKEKGPWIAIITALSMALSKLVELLGNALSP